MCPSQVHGAAGRPQERDGRGPQPGPRDGRQVRVQGRVLAEGEQHHAVLLWKLDRDDALVQRRLSINDLKMFIINNSSSILSISWFSGPWKDIADQ